MKKSFIILLFVHIVCSKIYSDSICKNILDKLMRNNKNIELANIEYYLDRQDINNQIKKWIPNISINTEAMIYGDILDASKYEWNILPRLIISQKLFAGSNLNIFIDNDISIRKDNLVKFNHSFSAEAQLNIPIFLFAPSIISSALKNDFYYQEFEKNFLYQKMQNDINTNLSNAIYLIGKYAIEEKKIFVHEQLKKYLQEIQESNQILWENGKISSLDFHKKLLEHNSIISNFELEKINFSILENSLYNLGLTKDDIPTDLETWIEEIEKYVEKTNIESILELDMQKNMIESKWHKNIDNQVSQLPKLFVSCQFKKNNLTTNEYDKYFLQSIKNSFKPNTSYNWQVSIGLNLSFNFFSELYQMNYNFYNTKRIYKLEKELLEKKYTEELNKIKKNIYLYDVNINQKNENHIVMQQHLEESKILYERGNIRKIDYEIEKIYFEKDKIDVLEERLNRIAYLVLFK